MPGKPKDPRRDYHPNWGGNRGGGPKRIKYTIRKDDAVTVHIRGREVSGVVVSIMQDGSGFAIRCDDELFIGVTSPPST